jgi:hypothetical protein
MDATKRVIACSKQTQLLQVIGEGHFLQMMEML